MTMRHLPAVLFGIFLVGALAACGKRGDLELPPGATPAPRAAEPLIVDDHELPIDLRPMRDGMGTPRPTRGSDD